MSAVTKGIFIIGAKRTPFGAFGGKLKHLSATDLAVISSKAAIAQANISPALIDETFMGNVISSSLDAAYLARHVALKSGLPIKSPSLTINRLCGSGFETVCLGAESILLGRSSVALCGGTESMSQAPMVIDGLSARFGTALGKGMKAEDSLWAGLTDSYAKLPMGLTAENLAEKYAISKEDCDIYGLRSQHLYEAANAAGVFDLEITEIEIKGKKGPEKVSSDEHPRKGSKIEDLQKLKPVFKENGVVSPGTASGICDGAASLVVCSEDFLKTQGCDPSIMGIGPVEAIRGALKAANLTLDDMDLVEINEAFAAQYIACERELGLDRNKTNLNGGAIAIGHPLGASGARIIAHLTHALNRTKKRYAIGAACIGGGQGMAIVLKNAHL